LKPKIEDLIDELAAMNERLNQTLTAPLHKTANAFARRYDASPPPSALAAAAAFSLHWSPYDPVGVVNAVP
jgi:hypothetical protein